MIGSIRLGSFLGIQVRMHWLFLVLVGVVLWLAALGGGGLVLRIGFALVALFGLVFLHELGHCLMARRFGIQVLDITFWPLGGMARMSEIPEDSKVEGWIAIAGPAVNLALAFLAAPVVVFSVLSQQGAGDPATASWVGQLAWDFVLINLMLGLFNLIPAFPMDGGRLLRAWLGRNGDWVAATESAVRVGRVFAVLMIGVGFLASLQGANFLPLIGMFVWISGSRELAVVRARHARYTNPLAAFGFGRVGGFARGQNGESEPRAAYAEAPRGPGKRSDSDPSGARRPATPLVQRARRGISAEEFERLERFPGSLLRPEAE